MNVSERVIFVATLMAALGSGLIGGLFFVFSDTIMKALGRLPVGDGAAAMRSINTTILNPLFLTIFLGTGAICLLLMVLSLFRRGDQTAVWLLVGGTLYLVGSLGVTMVFNVPMNNALDSSAEPNTDVVWAAYLVTWTRWNHVRTVASLAASVTFMLAIAVRGS